MAERRRLRRGREIDAAAALRALCALLALPALLAFATLAALATLSCAPSEPVDRTHLRVFYTSDAIGYIEPCG